MGDATASHQDEGSFSSSGQPARVEDPLTDAAPTLGLSGFSEPEPPNEQRLLDAHHIAPSNAVDTDDGQTASAGSPTSGVFGTAPTGVIGRHKPRDVVRIERSYEHGEICQFWSGFPPELEGRHVRFLNELNTVLAEAHNPYKNATDNCLAVLSLYLSTFVLPSHFERAMKKLYDIIDTTNREVYMPAGLRVLDPRPVAFLFLEIEYY